MSGREPRRSIEELLALADDELVLGWRNSKWTGWRRSWRRTSRSRRSRRTRSVTREPSTRSWRRSSAPRRTSSRSIGVPRSTAPHRLSSCGGSSGHDIARHYLYETADAVRIQSLMRSSDPEVAGLAEKIDREEVYHRIHAEMWLDRLLLTEDGRARLEEAVGELWPYALGVLDDELRPGWVAQVRARLPFELPTSEPVSRAHHSEELRQLWEQMTMVRRSQPSGTRW